MNIRRAITTDRHKWDEFVHSHPNSAPYQLFGWTKAVEEAYSFKKINLISEKNGFVSGVLPMTLFKIPLKKPVLISLPYCDLGCLLTENSSTEEALFNYAIKTAKEINASSIELRGQVSQSLLDKCSFPFSKRENKVRMLLSLPGTSKELWEGFKSKLRSQIRKAEKNGLHFEIANHKTDDFYAVFSRNMRDLGSPVHSKEWIQQIIKQLGNDVILGLVYHQDMAIGAGLIVKTGRKVSIPWASTLRFYNRLNPNMLLYWGFLEYAADNNCNLFDFGRSTPGGGTYRFKTQWGAQPQPLIWQTIYLHGSPSSPTHSSNGKMRIYQERIWQKLPLSFVNAVGPKVRKYINL